MNNNRHLIIIACWRCLVHRQSLKRHKHAQPRHSGVSQTGLRIDIDL